MIDYCFSTAWEFFKANAKQLIVWTLMLAGVYLLSQLLTFWLPSKPADGAGAILIASLVRCVLSLALNVVMIGMLRKVLQLYRGTADDGTNIFHLLLTKPFYVLVPQVLVGLIAAGCVIACFAPCLLAIGNMSMMGKTILLSITLAVIVVIYIQVIYFFLNMTLADELHDPMQTARQIVRGHKWEALFMLLLIMLTNMLGLICLVVGMIVTVPLTLVVMAVYYERLKAEKTNEL